MSLVYPSIFTDEEIKALRQAEIKEALERLTPEEMQALVEKRLPEDGIYFSNYSGQVFMWGYVINHGFVVDETKFNEFVNQEWEALKANRRKSLLNIRVKGHELAKFGFGQVR